MITMIGISILMLLALNVIIELVNTAYYMYGKLQKKNYVKNYIKLKEKNNGKGIIK